MTPVQLAPPLSTLGNLSTLWVSMSKTALATSEASLIQAPVNSNDLSFPTSSGLSRGKNMISASTRVPSGKGSFIHPVIGASNLISQNGNHSIHVLMVVDFSSGYVFRTTAHLVLRTPW